MLPLKNRTYGPATGPRPRRSRRITGAGRDGHQKTTQASWLAVRA
jgi:hypothetical protein